MDFQKLLSSFETLNAPKKNYDDNSEEFFKLTVDAAGNGSAIIRFLPSKDINDIPFVRIFHHGFKNEANGRWYIENSRSTIGETDPIAEMNSEAWNTGLEEKKEEARGRKRKLSYISNILVIKDPGNPANEGKVLKYKYGTKIMEKIMSAAKPDLELDPDAQAVNAYDPFEGANFSLVQAKVGGWHNYDQSKFGSKGALFKGDQKKIDAVLEKCFDINEEIAPSKFKSYEDLQKKLDWVLGAAAPSAIRKEVEDYEKQLDSISATSKEEKVSETRKIVKTPTIIDDDDGDAALFASLLND